MSSEEPLKNGKLPSKVLKTIASDFKERDDFWNRTKSHKVYHIQDWEVTNFIPGGRYFFRTHYVFDFDEGKSFLLDHRKELALVTDEKEVKRLRKIVSHQIKYFREGIFVRKLAVNRSSKLFELMLIMNDKFYLITRSFLRKKESERKQGETHAAKILFDLVISSK